MTGIVDTTRSSRDTTRTYPPLRLRRLIARAIDSVIAFGLACLIVLPFTFSQAADALLLAGFDSFNDFLTEWDPGTAAGGSVGAAVEQLQPVVLSTVYLQGLVIWAYDWLTHTLTGSSIGKAFTRVRVTRNHSSAEPTLAPDLRAGRSWVDRPLRMALRAGLVVGPPTLAAGMLLAAALAVPGAVDLAEMFIALTVVLLIAWLAGGVGLHGLVTGTRVVGFEWQELRQEAEHQIVYHTGNADEYLHKLQQAARTPGAQRAARIAEHDPRVRSAIAQARRYGARTPTGEVYRKEGLRGVVESFTQPPKESGGG
ncbi:RDD family protein [Ornithinimicrobium cavernae]|uniref:RDD family protein n=1 Tax=Ornithinimicrobium cavernae TaxID=2666047 RepID=UPI000D68EF45|nr:RDD family protein [Ornithinimicrobium cavernae]